MRLSWMLLLLAIGTCSAQLSLGPGGVGARPLNIVSVFRVVRRIVSNVMESWFPLEERAKVGQESRREEAKLEDEEVPTSDLKQKPTGLESKMLSPLEDENVFEPQLLGAKDAGLPENEEELHEVENDVEDETKSDCNATDGDCLKEVKASPWPTGQLVVGKWPAIYITLISLLGTAVGILAVPYYLTGQPLDLRRSLHSSPFEGYDEKDAMLLLTWILEQTGDRQECFSKTACLLPSKAGQYERVVSLASSLLKDLKSWLPFELNCLHELSRRLQDGLRERRDCGRFHCVDIDENFLWK